MSRARLIFTGNTRAGKRKCLGEAVLFSTPNSRSNRRAESQEHRKPHGRPPPAQAQIADAEAKLGFKFPPSYLIFLEMAGAYCMDSWDT